MIEPAAQPSVWYPRVTEKGAMAINDRHRYLLLHGPRKTTKTLTAGIKLAKHLYEIRSGVGVVVVKRKASGKIGVWNDIREIIEGMYQKEGHVLPWVKRPKMSSDTKTQSLAVRNGFGDVTWCHLLAAYYESDIYDLLKSTRFSYIYISEADQFETDTIFHAAADQMRVLGVDYDDHQMVLDCNPPEEGEEHWLHKTFINRPDGPSPDFHHIPFDFTDNPWMQERDRIDLETRYSTNMSLYDRMVGGLWVASRKGALFAEVFDEQIHVIGKADAFKPSSEWSVLLPPRGTAEIVCGWDLGQTSHAFVMFTKRMTGNESVFDQIDEVVSINLEVSIRKFVALVMEKRERWEQYLRQNGAQEVRWRDWSDTSSFEFDAGAEATPAMLVLQFSNRQIRLRPVTRAAKKIEPRIGMMTRMYKDRQIFHSILCKWSIGMARHIRKSALEKRTRSNPSQRRWTHPFDAITFVISSEIPYDVFTNEQARSGTLPDPGKQKQEGPNHTLAGDRRNQAKRLEDAKV